jgi:hypothetical protein
MTYLYFLITTHKQISQQHTTHNNTQQHTTTHNNTTTQQQHNNTQHQDTVSTVFTKQYGFRLNTVDYNTIVGQTCVADIDFYSDRPGDVPLTQYVV